MDPFVGDFVFSHVCHLSDIVLRRWRAWMAPPLTWLSCSGGAVDGPLVVVRVGSANFSFS